MVNSIQLSGWADELMRTGISLGSTGFSGEGDGSECGCFGITPSATGAFQRFDRMPGVTVILLKIAPAIFRGESLPSSFLRDLGELEDRLDFCRSGMVQAPFLLAALA